MDQYPQDPFSAVANEDGAQSRHEVRDSLFLMADFRITGSSKINQVRVRNLSPGGLMAELPNGLASGLPVEFDVRGIGWVAGKVAWSAAGRVGIAFDRAIDPMLARKPVGASVKTPVHVKPIFPKS